MPHITIKMYPGRTEDQKKELTQKVADATINAINCDPKHTSVAIEEIEKENWEEQVHKPEILGKKEIIYREPTI